MIKNWRIFKDFWAILIQGSKGCGKTYTGMHHAKSYTFLNNENKTTILLNQPSNIFTHIYPQLIDEWQIIPQIWDSVRYECDLNKIKGQFILTGSTSFNKINNNQINHSGIGRIVRFKMFPLSLYEMQKSNGMVSLNDLFNKNIKQINLQHKLTLSEIAQIIIQGGWPINFDFKQNPPGLIIAKNYYQSIIDDINQSLNIKIDRQILYRLLVSLARNESTIVNIKTITKDVFNDANEKEIDSNRKLITKYLNILEELFIVWNQEYFDINYWSSKRLSKTPKRHLIDPSLAIAALNLNEEKLLTDLNTFGFLFESLV